MNTKKLNLHFRRFEFKYHVPRAIADRIIPQMLNYMVWDEYSDGDEGYEVNSLYMDTGEFKCYHEKIDGLMNRKKARIRTYKKNVDDMRESPTLKLIEILEAKGAEVDYNDPHIPVMPKVRKYQYDMESVQLTPHNLNRYDVVLISTDHEAYDFDFIVKHANLVVDTRNATHAVKEGRERIVKA